jgi:hypothetical protein
MPDRYTRGPSTPRPIRYNDRLWADFTRYAKQVNLPTAVLIRQAMAEKLHPVPITQQADAAEDITIEVHDE